MFAAFVYVLMALLAISLVMDITSSVINLFAARDGSIELEEALDKIEDLDNSQVKLTKEIWGWCAKQNTRNNDWKNNVSKQLDTLKKDCVDVLDQMRGEIDELKGGKVLTDTASLPVAPGMKSIEIVIHDVVVPDDYDGSDVDLNRKLEDNFFTEVDKLSHHTYGVIFQKGVQSGMLGQRAKKVIGAGSIEGFNPIYDKAIANGGTIKLIEDISDNVTVDEEIKG